MVARKSMRVGAAASGLSLASVLIFGGCSQSGKTQDAAVVSRGDGSDTSSDAPLADVSGPGRDAMSPSDSRQQLDLVVDSPDAGARMDAAGDLAADGTIAYSDVALCPSARSDGGAAEEDGGAGPVATITWAPSTNQWGAELKLFCDGSASCRVLPCAMFLYNGRCQGAGNPTMNFLPSGTPWVARCLADLQAVGDVSTIRTVNDQRNCESVSNGNAITIAYGSSETNDLQCPLQPLNPAQSRLLDDCLVWACSGAPGM
jgi:hypothetical protein